MEPIEVAREYIRDSLQYGDLTKSEVQVAGLVAIYDAIERNTAVLKCAHGKPDATKDVYGKPEPDTEAPQRVLEWDCYVNPDVPTTIGTDRGSRPLGDDMGVNLDRARWEPLVVADKDGDKPIETDAVDNRPPEARISPVGLVEGASVNTPPRTERETAAAINHDAALLAARNDDHSQNVIIGVSVEDVTLFKSHNRRYAMWHTVYPGAESRMQGMTVGDWVATSAAAAEPTSDVAALIDMVKTRQAARRPIVTDTQPSSGYNHHLGKYATGGRITGNGEDADSILGKVIDCGYRLNAEQVKSSGVDYLAAFNRGTIFPKPSTDIDTTAGKLNAEHLGRRISLHSVEQAGTLMSIEHYSERSKTEVAVELDSLNGAAWSRWLLELDAAVTVHTDYPDVTIGDNA